MFSIDTRKLLTTIGLVALLPLSGCSTPSEPYPLARGLEEETVVGDYLKARFAAGQQQLDVAADAYARAAEAAPQDTLLLRHAFFYELASGNIHAAADLARTLSKPEYRLPAGDDDTRVMTRQMAQLRMQQSLALPVLTLAAEQMRDGDYDKALETLGSEKQSAYAQSIAYLMEAWATFETDGLEAGLAVLDKEGTQTFTGFAPLHRALMYEAAGRKGEARQAYEAALETYPAEQTRIARASFLEREGEREAALAAYREMVAENGVLHRTGRLGLIRMGEALDGETEEMIRQARRHRLRPLVRSGADGAGLALYHFAWTAYRQAMTEQAAAMRVGFTAMPLLLNTPLAFAQLSVHLNPDLEASDYLIGGIYGQYEMYESAVEALAKVSFNDSFYEYAVTDMAGAYEELGDAAAARAALQAHVESDIFAVSAALRRAPRYANADQNDEAEETLTRAIARIEARPQAETARDLWRYYFSRGILYTDMDNWAKAESDLLKASDMSDGDAYVLNFLGYSWVERGENLTEAFAMIEKALEKEPTSGAITDSLGWAHYQLGNYETAIDYLERAVRLEPADPVITDHLGDAYFRTGRRTEARYEWRRALSYEPDEDLRAQIESKLAKGEIVTATRETQ